MKWLTSSESSRGGRALRARKETFSIKSENWLMIISDVCKHAGGDLHVCHGRWDVLFHPFQILILEKTNRVVFISHFLLFLSGINGKNSWLSNLKSMKGNCVALSVDKHNCWIFDLKTRGPVIIHVCVTCSPKCWHLWTTSILYESYDPSVSKGWFIHERQVSVNKQKWHKKNNNKRMCRPTVSYTRQNM